MSPADVTALVLLLGVTLYAIFGAADFGGGVWDLLAGNEEKGRERRALIEHAMGPVWEANHVWLIFGIVILWTGFPEAFVSVMTTLWIPMTAVGLGVILRGSSFAFRKPAATMQERRLFGATFALSSLVTPFFLGASVGAVASGRVPLGNALGDPLWSWCSPTGWLGGILAVLTCAHIAAVFLAAEAARHDRPSQLVAFRGYAIGSGLVVGATSLVGIFVLRDDAPLLFDGLWGQALPCVALSVVAGVLCLICLFVGRYLQARAWVSLAVASIIFGWGLGQYPDALPGRATIEEVAAPPEVLRAILWSLGVGAMVLVPSLYLLFRIFHGAKRQ